MKSATRLFYLAIFTAWAPPAVCDSSDSCGFSSGTIVEDACASYATLDQVNAQIKPSLDDLTRTTDFFSHYRLNLFNKQCPFWDDDGGICGNIGCAVETLDNEDDVPEVWRASELSKLEGPLAKHPGQSGRKKKHGKPLQGGLGEGVGESCVFEYDDEYDDRDYCVPEDESAGGDYVSLLRNPERFTGYGGEGSHDVWDAIYRENCFQRSSFPTSANVGSSSELGPAEHDFRQVLDSVSQLQRLSKPNDAKDSGTDLLEPSADQCLEKRVFYRVISGMHASISAHLCWDFLNQTTGEWQPNQACYEWRLHKHPDRVSNLYFNYALVTRAVAKLGPHLKSPAYYTFCNDDASKDQSTRAKALDVARRAAEAPQLFNEGLMFVNGEGPSLKEDFRNRFRNVSRLMDCVGCDKCRLWGKVQTAGYGTALKVLFEFDEKNNAGGDVPPLKRTELVALFNTYARLSESLSSLAKFRTMLEADEEAVINSDERVARVGGIEQEEEEPLEDFIKPQLKRRTRLPADAPIADVFDQEFGMMIRAFKLVVGAWIRFPITLYHIILSESIRLYQFWLGLPVSPRQWRFELPKVDRDEL
ncbi:hypothetical protein GMORB2_3645 [Geosmithia morbida]|uniref:Uncharacterized protein n=1 Tax=Geosmithia morbida TaxID=1094350 RepID=A0A9P4YXB8_9HYPO|nr:uncharacterized protein GMORB2_3645 [Geosmithia morbida]KAF4124806.1 hypothetical protein GMORB2_3645 [Geosmithia morbida]